MLRTLLLSLVVSLFQQANAQIHVAPTGNDNNNGTLSSPWLTIQYAVNMAMPGDTIIIHEGRYLISKTIRIPEKQTSDTQRCYLWSDGDAVIDGSAISYGNEGEFKNSRCIYLDYRANYWHIKGLTMCNAPDNGMKIEGSYNIVEQCVFRDNNDTGLQIGMGMVMDESQLPSGFPVGEPLANPDYRYSRGNKVINCDSYNNADLRKYGGLSDNGGDADGFACKLFPGPGNEFHGCRAWNNSDDNWDLYMVYHPVVIDSCWSYKAGYTSDGRPIGNGNGFKLGGGGSSGGAAFPRSTGTHIVSNCVAFDNLAWGFDQNGAAEGMTLINNIAWGNACNYMFNAPLLKGSIRLQGCIGFNSIKQNYKFHPANISDSPDANGNSWDEKQAERFIGLSPSLFMAPRKADGSLPDNGFAKLKD
ncbi:MAG: right-handed parallel beta-helix repeat-containing protein [Prevotella sp.]|nr:right-handed parallel beta-helix repeat-containing protein [Prevotella sp.]